jgi:hypothetical protein
MNWKHWALLVACALGLSFVAVPAQAATWVSTRSCSAGGMTGYLKVTHSGTGTVYRIEYKITNNGRNAGNVYWHDYGTAPSIHSSTTSARQDGRWHVLREANYTRGQGHDEFKFIFDKPGDDPRCSKNGPLP